MKIVNYAMACLIACFFLTSCKTNVPDNTLSEEQQKEGWILLFDGKTTTNFRGYNKTEFPTKGWEVVEGMLHCIGSGAGEAGGGGGDIITTEKFKDFELELEWKISPGGNSGIFILAQEDSIEPIYKSSPEMQILDNEKHPDAKLGKDGNRTAGSLYDMIPTKSKVNKVGEWNKVKITVYQGTVVFNMNGENGVEFHLWTDDWKKMCADSKFKDWPKFVDPAKEGYIGLQDHGNDVWFKNIKIKKL